VPQVQAMTAQARDVHAPAAWPSQRAGHTRARLILIAPVAEVLTSPLVFGLLRRRYGERAGYLLGFVWYWLAWGLLFPLWAVGPRALAETLRAPRRRGPGRRAISLAALAGPPVGALAAAGLGSLGDADVTEIAISVAVAAVNSAAEELLWRGVFLARYPRSVIAGCLYPSVLFGASHLGPLSVRPSKRGSAAFVAAATALGYVYGLEARSSRSLRGTIASHLLTDAVGGLQTAAFLAGRETRQEDQ
jgi:membrane protease YdiL (CAAX protease family)